LPYDHDPNKLRLSMKIGGRYRLEDIGRRNWEKLASETRLPAADMVAECARLATDLPAIATEVATREMLDHPLVTRMVEILTLRAERCRRALEG
jgi:hypothetical protein